MLHSNRKGEITSQYYTGTSLILKGEKKWQSNKISSFTDEGKCTLTLLKTFRVQSRVTAELATSIAQFPNHGRTACCPVSQGRLYRLSPFFSKIFRAPKASELLSPQPQRVRKRSHPRFLPCANWYEFSNKSIRTKEIVFEFSQAEASL